MKTHNYDSEVKWIGNEGVGTLDYRKYNRDYTISSPGKSHLISGSSDASFLGNSSRYNPEETFFSTISACHMLWYLHLCSTKGVVVTSYADTATGIMKEESDGFGRFTSVILNPKITVQSKNMIEMAIKLHKAANDKYFIVNSCNFTIYH